MDKKDGVVSAKRNNYSHLQMLTREEYLTPINNHGYNHGRSDVIAEFDEYAVVKSLYDFNPILYAHLAKYIKQEEKDCDVSGLLNRKKRKDYWFMVIDDMVRDFYAGHGKMPNAAQAWKALCTSPPLGYEITVKEVENEMCLHMILEAPMSLSKTDFNRRWKRYTCPLKANKDQNIL
jgi:hypothetical protein